MLQSKVYNRYSGFFNAKKKLLQWIKKYYLHEKITAKNTLCAALDSVSNVITNKLKNQNIIG